MEKRDRLGSEAQRQWRRCLLAGQRFLFLHECLICLNTKLQIRKTDISTFECLLPIRAPSITAGKWGTWGMPCLIDDAAGQEGLFGSDHVGRGSV